MPYTVRFEKYKTESLRLFTVNTPISLYRMKKKGQMSENTVNNFSKRKKKVKINHTYVTWNFLLISFQYFKCTFDLPFFHPWLLAGEYMVELKEQGTLLRYDLMPSWSSSLSLFSRDRIDPWGRLRSWYHWVKLKSKVHQNNIIP